MNRLCLGAVAGVVAILLSGCANQGSRSVATGADSLARATSVVTSARELTPHAIDLGKDAYFQIDARAEVLDEGGTRHFALLVALPPATTAYSVRISSAQFGSAQDPAILYPAVRILDSRRDAVRTLAAEAFVFRTGTGQNFLQAEIFFNDASKDERYLLLTNRTVDTGDQIAAAHNVTTMTSASVPVAGGLAFWMIPTGVNAPPARLMASPTGSVSIRAEVYRLRKVQ